MPAHCRMRAYDRDLIRGGHYGQRPRVPHKQAEHMAAPTNAANVKKVLANSEPSTHGTKQTSKGCRSHMIFFHALVCFAICSAYAASLFILRMRGYTNRPNLVNWVLD